MNITELKQQRALLINENAAIIEAVDKEQRGLVDEEQSKFDKNLEAISKFDMEIDTSERRERVKYLQDGLKAQATPKAGPTAITSKRDEKSQRNAFRGWLKLAYQKPLTNEERSACDLHGVGFGMQNWTVPSNKYTLSSYPEQRALSEGSWTISGSGSAAPLFTYMNISDLIDTALKAYGNILNTSTIIETPNAWPLPLPTVNDTSNQAGIVAENGALTPVDLGSTASVIFGAYKLATAVVFSQELLQDALFPLESYLAQQLGVRMSRGMESYLCNGTNSSQPQGLAVAATNSSITLAGTSAAPVWSFDNLIDLINSIDPAYLQQEGVGFLAHQTTIAAWQKIKSTTGEYLWQESGPAMGNQATKPLGMIRGYPVYMNNQMEQMGTQNNVLAVFGQLKKYNVRKVSEVQFFTNPYLYSLNGQIVLQAWLRFDSRLIDAGTHPVKAILNP